jgi:hypothetical protein
LDLGEAQKEKRAERRGEDHEPPKVMVRGMSKKMTEGGVGFRGRTLEGGPADGQAHERTHTLDVHRSRVVALEHVELWRIHAVAADELQKPLTRPGRDRNIAADGGLQGQRRDQKDARRQGGEEGRQSDPPSPRRSLKNRCDAKENKTEEGKIEPERVSSDCKPLRKLGAGIKRTERKEDDEAADQNCRHKKNRPKPSRYSYGPAIAQGLAEARRQGAEGDSKKSCAHDAVDDGGLKMRDARSLRRRCGGGRGGGRQCGESVAGRIEGDG